MDENEAGSAKPFGTLSNENAGGGDNASVGPGQGVKANAHMNMDIDSRGRSLPPLRQSQHPVQEFRKHELLQQTMIKSIQKRNKQNAAQRTHGNTSM